MSEQAVQHRTDTWIWLLVIAATASVVTLAVLQGRRLDDPGTSHGKSAPGVTLPLLGGGKSSIQQGKVTLVDFWATWCPPCRYSMPRVQKLYEQYNPGGMELYSVDTDDVAPEREAQVREFLLQNKLTFPVVLDDGTAERAFAIANLPTMLLLGKDGKVVWTHIGALTAPAEQDLRAQLDRALSR